MKKVLLFVISLCFSLSALAQQGAIIKGETSPGVYTNIKADANGILSTSLDPTIVLTSKPFAVSSSDWSYAAATGGIITTADVVAKTAAGASVRNYVTALSCQNASATVPTEMVLKDGATVLWRAYLGTGSLLNSAVGVVFPSPLKGTANTAVNLAAITTASQVYCNAQGYTGP